MDNAEVDCCGELFAVDTFAGQFVLTCNLVVGHDGPHRMKNWTKESDLDKYTWGISRKPPLRKS